MKFLILSVLLVNLASAAEPSQKLVDRIGPEVIELVQAAERAEAFHAGAFEHASAGKEGTVGMRVIEGEAVPLSAEQLETLKEILVADSTYFNQDSKGTKHGYGLRLWSKDGRCLEVSYCTVKGNINLVAKDGAGEMIRLRKAVPGGFRNDKQHPMRPFTASIFPGDPNLEAFVGQPIEIKEMSPKEKPLATETAKADKPAAAAGISHPLLADDARIEVLAEGFKFLEGPANGVNGDLFFVDKNANKVLRWHANTAEVTQLTDDSKGANGMQLDENGHLIACQGEERRIVMFDAKTATVIEVLADQFEGKRFNNPNDLWIDAKGGIYFTDPAYSRKKEELELDGCHVYYITPGEKEVVKVADGFNTPNGIVGTRDGKTLYITDRRLGRVWTYAIQPDGSLTDKKQFCKVGADGMDLDAAGNLYTTPNKPELRVFAPDGTELPPIPLPRPATNVCVGGIDGKTLFITSQPALLSVRLK